MARLLLIACGLAALFSSPREPAVAAEPDAAALAAAIDRRLAERLNQEGIVPAPAADDAEFLRRAYLDLTGRIPRPADVHRFLADQNPHKRQALVDRLLADPRYAVHQSQVWRAELMPEAAFDRQVELLQRGLETWLVEQFRANRLYDRLVRDLVAVPLPAEGQSPEPVLRDPARANPLAFIASKDARPEKLAAAVARTFLGVRLECAECHNHPFARWSQEQFWNQAAFFGGLNRQGNGFFAPLTERRQRRDTVSQADQKNYTARLLDGVVPDWEAEKSSREYLADWLISPQNNFFAQATANRLWAQFFGAGLVEPVDDFHDDNPPADAPLMQLVSQAVISSGYDLKHLTRALCLTQAYGRTSARTHLSQDATTLPARMTVKALTGEQFFDSLALATGYRQQQDQGSARKQFLGRFARSGPPHEPETSVQQALTLLNGNFVSWATDPERNPTLIGIVQTPGLSIQDRTTALYQTTLSRPPTAAETEQLEQWRARQSTPPEQHWADLFWLLLNSAEFRLNH